MAGMLRKVPCEVFSQPLWMRKTSWRESRVDRYGLTTHPEYKNMSKMADQELSKGHEVRIQLRGWRGI